MHVPTMMSDLALILISAGIVTIIFKWLKQPVVLGYIVAGCLIGNQISLTPTVVNSQDVGTWSDIGVVFLLFALGLEFSFKKLFSVGKTAMVATLVIISFMIIFGTLVGKAIGWNTTNSLMLGGMISMSSTTIILKALDDLGLRTQKFTNVVFAILILEDLMAILLMVVISSVAVSNSFQGTELLINIGKLLFFLTIWLVMGIFFIPTFFKRSKNMLNDETMLIVSLGLCLGMVMFATKVHFSSALGAFVMGSILAETIEAEYIERLVKPVKDLFGAIFFVSVGMMVDFSVIVEYWSIILVITLTVIIGQIVFATIGILLSGQTLKVAVQSSFCLTQIGEFAFIIASLGTSLGLIDSYIYPVIVAVSVITIFVTPFMIKLSAPVYSFLERKVPEEWLLNIGRHSECRSSRMSENVWHTLLLQLLRIVSVYLSIVVAIVVLSVGYFIPFLDKLIPNHVGATIAVAITILLISPSLRAIMAKKNRSREYKYLYSTNKMNRYPLLFLTFVRFVLSVAICTYIIRSGLPRFSTSLAILISVALALAMCFSKLLKFYSINIERMFFKNLNLRETELKLNVGNASPFERGEMAEYLSVYDMHFADLEVSKFYSSIGKQLKQLNFRQRIGVHIVSIIRGNERINIPGGNEQIFPMDKILALGTDEQLRQLEVELQTQSASSGENVKREVGLEQILIDENSPLKGKSIIDSGIRDKSRLLVVGFQRDKQTIMNPDIRTQFVEGDVVWIVGEPEKIHHITNFQETVSVVAAK